MTVKGDLLVGQGVIMNGTLTVPGLAEVDGQIDGVLKANSINVTNNGVITGSSSAQHIRVAGAINNDISAEVSLLVESSGKVAGNIAYADLEIRRGGDLQVQIKILGSKSKRSFDDQ